MSEQAEVPDGCLGCNDEVMREYLEGNGFDISRLTEVPRPRHEWSDVICCESCGRAWLIKPAEAVQ